MDICKLFLLQLLAHILADFIFQNDEWTKEKKKFGIRSRKLYWHILIVFVLSWALSFQWNFLLFSLVISSLHFVMDAFKFSISDFKSGKIKPFKNMVFFIDQFIHT